MINNTSEDGRPYFLTAYHCGINAGKPPPWWSTGTSRVRPAVNRAADPRTSSRPERPLRAFSATSDFKLLELDDEPDASYGVKYAGWDRSSVDPSLAVAIHHPNTDEKSISFENDPLTTTTYLQSASPGNGTHLRIADWDLGTTEPGSSGSPLFNPAHRIVGQLHGGYAACGNDESDWYGRLSVSWDGDGTAATRLSDWLDPGGTGALTTDLYDPSWVGPQPGDHANLQIGAAKPNPFTAPMLLAYTVDRDSDVAARIFDIRGCLVRDLGVQTASFGDNNLFWNGRDGGGRTVPAGLYIVEMTAEGVTQRTRVVFLH